MSARDELIAVILPVLEKCFDSDWNMTYSEMVADALIADGVRKVFDGDCGLSNIKDPTERESAEAWMRWANLVNTGDGEPNGIAAMQQMLTEFGYRKPRTITTAEELDALPEGSVALGWSVGGKTAYLRAISGRGRLVWGCVGSSDCYESADLLKGGTQATVLHEAVA